MAHSSAPRDVGQQLSSAIQNAFRFHAQQGQRQDTGLYEQNEDDDCAGKWKQLGTAFERPVLQADEVGDKEQNDGDAELRQEHGVAPDILEIFHDQARYGSLEPPPPETRLIAP